MLFVHEMYCSYSLNTFIAWIYVFKIKTLALLFKTNKHNNINNIFFQAEVNIEQHGGIRTWSKSCIKKTTDWYFFISVFTCNISKILKRKTSQLTIKLQKYVERCQLCIIFYIILYSSPTNCFFYQFIIENHNCKVLCLKKVFRTEKKL